MKARALPLLALFVAAAGCGDVDVDPSTEDGLSTATGQVATIEWDGYVDVAPDADVATIQRAIQRQVKSAIGALRQPEVAIQDRDALRNIAAETWRRETLTVAGTSTTVQRVRYHYRDNALVRVPITNAARPAPGTQPSRTLQLTLLAGDYVARADTLRPVCSDDPRTDADSLWFHYAPHFAPCQQAIRAEAAAINAASAAQRPTAGQVTRAEVDRSFLTVRADLRPQATPAATTKYPEYHRLWGLDSDRTMLVVYAFFGVDNDLRDTRDNSLVEFMRFVSTVRARFPGLQVTDTRPYASLLDFNVNGTALSASYADVTRWIVDGQGYPPEIGRAHV